MFTHQRPAMPSRYSRPSASTTVESFEEAMTSWRSSSCLWGTMGWITLSRSRRTRSARLPAAGVSGLVVIAGSSFSGCGLAHADPVGQPLGPRGAHVVLADEVEHGG